MLIPRMHIDIDEGDGPQSQSQPQPQPQPLPLLLLLLLLLPLPLPLHVVPGPPRRQLLGPLEDGLEPALGDEQSGGRRAAAGGQSSSSLSPSPSPKPDDVLPALGEDADQHDEDHHAHDGYGHGRDEGLGEVGRHRDFVVGMLCAAWPCCDEEEKGDRGNGE
ncbi:hypothetical protein Hte_003370 [Hypoxylon texense]